MILIGICATAVCVGCRGQEEPGASGSSGAAPVPTIQPEEPETPPEPVPVEMVEETLPAEMPQVRMTDADRATCRVAIGDAMPEGELPDPQGASRPLAELLGKSRTVIFFWTEGDSPFSKMAATAALQDLQSDVLEPLGGQGVAVVAINEHDSADAVAARAKEAGATFPTLLDPGGAYFAAVATERLPRVYLVDAEGKILWFDLEYTETTRESLMQAIHASK
jgi:peroxiredoxin